MYKPAGGGELLEKLCQEMLYLQVSREGIFSGIIPNYWQELGHIGRWEQIQTALPKIKNQQEQQEK